MNKKLIFAIGLFAILSSCGKDDPSPTTPDVTHSVVVAGWSNPPDASPNGAFYAKLWNNGNAQLLNASGESHALDITVKGSDVYVAGFNETGSVLTAAYWINGVLISLPNATNGTTVECAKAVYATDSVVFIAGGPFYSGTTGTLWRNGNPVALQGCEDAVDVTMYGSDVYVAGMVIDPNSGLVTAAYWKNGIMIPMGDGSTGTTANSLVVSGSDVYVVGRDVDFEIARLWKNGQIVNLPGIAFYSDAADVAIDGQNVYVLVTEEDQNTGNVRTVVYKNNTRSVLSNDPSVNTEGTGLVVKDGVVYVCGFRTDNNTGNERAVYWKNGSLVNLSDGGISEIASGIFVH